MTKIVLGSVLAAAALASVAGSTGAVAATSPRTVSTIVRYGDLNLANPDGARAMIKRIKNAARQVCEPAPESVLEYPDWRDCVGKATDRAVARLDAPTVTAAYGGKRANSIRLAQNSSH